MPQGVGDARHRFAQRLPRAVEQAVRLLQRLHDLRRQPPTSQADAVERAHASAVAADGVERRHVALHHRAGRHHRRLADAEEQTDRREPAEDGVVAHLDVAAKEDAARHHHLIADADSRARRATELMTCSRCRAGHATALHGAAVHGDELAEAVSVADHQPRRLARIAAVLRRAAEHRVRVDLVVPAELQRALEHGVGADPRSGADTDPGADDRVRPDRDVRLELRAAIRRRWDARRRRRWDGGRPWGSARWGSHHPHQELGLGDALAVDAPFALESEDRAALLDDRELQLEPIAGHDRLAEARTVDSQEEERLASELAAAAPAGVFVEPASSPSPARARRPATCAIASRMSTPGIMGWPGKCP